MTHLLKKCSPLPFFLFILIGSVEGTGEELLPTGASLSQRDRHVEARLLGNRSHIGPGETWWVALELKHDPTWHTYWQNGGDAGVPTLIEWTLPEGITAGPIQWETPQIVKMGKLDVYGYEGTCLLLTPFKSDPKVTLEDKLNLKAFVNWMMCARTCMPGKGVNLQLQLDVKNSKDTTSRTKWSDRIEQAVNRLPGPAPKDMFTANLDSQSKMFHLKWETFPGAGEVEDVYFFDLTEQITSDEPQTLEQNEEGWQLSLPRASYASGIPMRMKGCLRWKMAGADQEFQWAQLDVPMN
ncbi:protein-disulfide reductase DsbD family protein [bacterium]|nr:protein-disulfide reductase DsbD family protein [bacterium]